MAFTCPQGHSSSTGDFCDVCGSPIAAGAAASPAPPPNSLDLGAPAPAPAPASAATATAAPRVCPNCADPNPSDALFCEQCGYDFTTGQLPPPPAPVEAGPSVVTPLVGPAPSPTGVDWVAEVWVDPGWFGAQGAEGACPQSRTPAVVPLPGPTALIGRRSSSQRAAPEIECSGDSAVSHRHAQLSLDGDRWSVEDLGSTNGTFVGGPDGTFPSDPLPVDQRRELAPDERVYVGAWTRVVVRRATADEKSASATP